MPATYRLQLHADFTFADAEAEVPYLARLGVSHLYLSPVLQAVPGSRHGYDVLDHTRINTELGGEEGLLSLAGTAREHGLGIIVDVVPNHMALVAPEHANRPLWQTLREGRDAPTAHWFDIDWEAGGGRLGLPVLGGTLEEAVAAGEVRLDEYDGQQAVRYYDHVLPVAPGTEGEDVTEVLARQHYLLAHWRDSDAVLNYRRFFDVAELIAVRVELPEVFDATHGLLLDLNRRGIIEGFRIDHPDGLADPEGYLRRLREATVAGTGIWVEKILEGEERLPASWPCEGTTGYDAMRAVTAALADPEPLPVLDECWTEAGGELDLDHAVERAKRTVVGDLLGPEVTRLTRRACDALPELDEERVRDAVTELLVASEVYRAYIRPEERVPPLARRRLADARAEAVEARPDLEPELTVLARLATAEGGSEDSLDFAIRLQQTWGPVMAKGVEDTTFYRWHRLVALNEVGGDPGVLERADPSILHEWAADQQAQWPLGMTTLSTHDTKRSEDVRARLLAVAQDPQAWASCSRAFREAADAAGVDRPTAHLLWQTLVGVGPVSTERLHGYLVKAMREAKRHTAWIDGSDEYEQRVLALADQATGPGPLREVVEQAVADNEDAVRACVLGQRLLQLMLPGTPDTYQGCELVNLSLVDPDNRRPVDYPARHARLERLDAGETPKDLDDEKLLVTTAALRLRRERPELFGDAASYQPVPATTEHLLGYLRGDRVACLVTRFPRRLRAAGGWEEQRVELPGGPWQDRLTGQTLPGGPTRCAEVFATLPVALLVREEPPGA